MTYFHCKVQKYTKNPNGCISLVKRRRRGLQSVKRNFLGLVHPVSFRSPLCSCFCQPKGTEAQNTAAPLYHRGSCYCQLGCPQQQVWTSTVKDDAWQLVCFLPHVFKGHWWCQQQAAFLSLSIFFSSCCTDSWIGRDLLPSICCCLTHFSLLSPFTFIPFPLRFLFLCHISLPCSLNDETTV